MGEEHGFVTGLIAGEGSFLIALDERSEYTYNIWAQPTFTIFMHEKNVLEKVRDEVQVGKIYDRSTDREGADQIGVWSVRNQDAISALIEYIEQDTSWFRESKKYQQYSRWKEGVEAHQEMEHCAERQHTLVDVAFDVGLEDKKRNRTREEFHKLINQGGTNRCGVELRDGSTCQKRVKKHNDKCHYHEDYPTCDALRPDHPSATRCRERVESTDDRCQEHR